jgi:hypothetical protein
MERLSRPFGPESPSKIRKILQKSLFQTLTIFAHVPYIHLNQLSSPDWHFELPVSSASAAMPVAGGAPHWSRRKIRPDVCRL